MNERHTITLSDQAFEELRLKGKFGESYSELVLRLVEALNSPPNKGETCEND
jgi:predicted CopG family antitoxin